MTLMHRNVFGFVALNFILGIIGTSVMGISFVIDVFCMYLDDLAADLAGLRVPGHVIADLESFAHHERPPSAVVRLPGDAEA